MRGMGGCGRRLPKNVETAWLLAAVSTVGPVKSHFSLSAGVGAVGWRGNEISIAIVLTLAEWRQGGGRVSVAFISKIHKIFKCFHDDISHRHRSI